MTRYLLDTNIISHIVRHPLGAPAKRFNTLPREAAATSIIVVAELRFGLAKRPSASRAARIATVLAALDTLAFDVPDADAYGDLRAALERAGMRIGANDMLIAAQAIAAGLALVTANEGEFRRVPGLKVENWLTSAASAG